MMPIKKKFYKNSLIAFALCTCKISCQYTIYWW